MNMNNLLLFSMLVLPLSVFAMPGMGEHPMPPHHQSEQMAKELGLNDEQKVKLAEVFKQQHEKFRAIHEETHLLIKQLLTPEQVAQWEKMKQLQQEQYKQKAQKQK